MKTKNVLALTCALFAFSSVFYSKNDSSSLELSDIQNMVEENIPSKASMDTLSSNLMFSISHEQVAENFATSLAQFIKEHFNEPSYADYVSQNGDAPDSNTIGRAVTPSDSMSMSRKLMPSCFGASGSVRTRQKIQSETSAVEVQIF